MTLEGRIDDIVTFLEEGEEIKIAPLAIYAVLKEIHEIQRFQVIAYKGNRLELRLNPVNGQRKEEVFITACTTLKNFLASHGIQHVEISLSTEEPKQHPQSGKFKHVINAGCEMKQKIEKRGIKW